MLIYSSLNILYAVAGILIHGADSPRMHHPVMHLAIFCGIIGFVFLMDFWEKRSKSKVLSFIRDWYGIALFLYYFETASAFNRVIFPDFIDDFFVAIDQWIFGYQPAVEWGLRYDHWLISEIFHFAYFSYYLMGLFYLWVYIKKRDLFYRYVFQLCFVFYVCYITYNILPVIGGRYLEGMMELTQQYQHGPFTHIMAFIYRMSPHLGGAFPSSHVAIAIVVTMSAFHYCRKTGWYILPVTILLTISTVYGHYHYFIDTIFGIFYGIGFYYLSGRVFEKYTKKA